MHVTYWQYLSGFDSWIDFGVLWFAAALLLFTVVYVFKRLVFNDKQKRQVRIPASGLIVLFAIGLGIITFFTRIVFPVGWVLKPLGFQLGHFPQYIILFATGIFIYRNKWLDQLTVHTGKRFAFLAICGLFVFPLFYLIKQKTGMPLIWFSGGFHWQSLMYSIWEQCMGISIIIALLSISKNVWNKSSATLAKISRATFAVYILHPLVVISLSLAFRNWTVDPATKLLIVAPLAVLLSFTLGMLVLLIPAVKKLI